MTITTRLLVAVAWAVIFASSAVAGSKDPIEGTAFDELLASRDPAFLGHLVSVFPESEGYVVAGALDPSYEGDDALAVLFHSPRVVCATLGELDRAAALLEGNSGNARPSTRGDHLSESGFGHAGVVTEYDWNGRICTVVLMTFRQTRWLVWLDGVVGGGPAACESESVRAYSVAVVDHLRRLDEQDRCGGVPVARDFGLPAACDFYPPRPDYVIQGYQNYKDYLHDHSDIETFFADGILAFVPSDSLLGVLAGEAPKAAWPNKEAPLLQYEFNEFFERGGDVRVMRTLTSAVLDTLKSGEYFYAVGLEGTIRFAYEVPREEVARIEKETGRKVARANHAFLFPGEPVLTAGAFFVERDPSPRIVEVNTHSGHYFYSNVTQTIRRDIAVRSDDYLLTIGHFFRALDREGIPYRGILISKM